MAFLVPLMGAILLGRFVKTESDSQQNIKRKGKVGIIIIRISV
jgi:hypothetical protein